MKKVVLSIVLALMFVGCSEEGSLERIKPQILEELNVKDLKIDSFSEVAKLDGHGYVVSGMEGRIDKEKGYKVLTW